jgi:hypothetical protein
MKIRTNFIVGTILLAITLLSFQFTFHSGAGVFRQACENVRTAQSLMQRPLYPGLERKAQPQTSTPIDILLPATQSPEVAQNL